MRVKLHDRWYKKLRRLKPGYAAINKNLANYTIARDVRVVTHWRRSNKTRRWLCDLPGDKRIQYRLPSDYKQQRCPTGFDVNVLFVLLRESRLKKTGKVEFASLASILETLGVSINDYNRRRLRDSLKLWSLLSIRHVYWYEATKWGGKVTREQADAAARREKHVRKLLPPPILSTKTDSRLIRVTVAKAWRELAAYFYAQVPLPLPLAAATQNLVVYLLADVRWRDFPEEGFAVRYKVRGVCHKIGLNHARRGAGLRYAVVEARAWFRQHGIELEDYGGEHEGVIRLGFFAKPKIDRVRLQEQTPALEPDKSGDEGDDEDDGYVYDEDGNKIG